MSALSFSSFSSDLDYIHKHGKDRDTARAQHRPTYTNEEMVRLAGLAPAGAHKELDQIVASADSKMKMQLQAAHNQGTAAFHYLYNGGSYEDGNGTINVAADPGDNSGAVYLLNKAMADGIRHVDQLHKVTIDSLRAFGDKHAHMRHDLLLAAKDITTTYTATINDIANTLAFLTSKAALWQPKSPSADSGLGAWLKKAFHSVGQFFAGVGHALKAAFDAFMKGAENALKAVIKTIDKAMLAALPGHAKKYVNGLTSKDITAAVTAAHSKYPNEIALVRGYAAAHSKHPSASVGAAVKTLAKHFEPQNKKVAAHIKSVDPKAALGSTCGFTIAEELDASYFVGIGGSVGMEFGLAQDPEPFFDLGVSFGAQGGANGDLVIGFVVGPESNFKGFSGSVVFSASDEASVLFRVSFSLSPLQIQGISMGVGVGAGLAVAGEVSYTWVGDS